MILEIFPSGPLQTNAVLVGCTQTKKAVVIDVPMESTEPLLKRIHHLKLGVEQILLTHSHWDHIVEVKKLKTALKVPVSIHAEDEPNLRDPGADGLPLHFPIEGVAADSYLTDNEIIPIGKLKARVIHTPGHTPGSVCFYIESEKVVITGDTLFRGSIGRLNFPKSRPDLMQSSLNKLAKLPKETRVIPGHGKSTTIGDEDWLERAQEIFGF